MPTPPKFSSPRLELHITSENWENAVQAKSGGCLIADAIKRQYPQFSGIRVDMATVRMTDRKKGLRYMYLTPPPGQHCLLSFDQGWSQPTEEVKIGRAVKVTKVLTTKKASSTRAEKIATLEAKRETEGLTKAEKQSLTRLKNTGKRPTSYGKAEMNREGVVHGGRPSIQNAKDPNANLLRGSDRHFGAKLSDPGEVFNKAVDEAVALKLAEAASA